MDCTFGFKVVCSEWLTGQPRPILSDGVLVVSPAIWHLMRHSNEEELEHLLKNLFPIEIPGLFKVPDWPEPILSKESTNVYYSKNQTSSTGEEGETP